MGGRFPRARDERGSVLLLTCIAIVVMVGFAALAVDVGQETVRNRRLEQVADAIAFDAARAINGSTVSQLSAAGGPVTVAVSESAARNGYTAADLTVELGTMSGTAFVKQDPAVSPNAVPTTARVSAKGTTKFAFAPGAITGARDSTGSRAATVVRDSTAGFSIGSWLASVSPPGDTVLNAIFGDSFKAQVASYSGLANANVSLAAIGLNMPVTALSPSQLLSTSVSAKNLMLASAAALNDGSHTAAVSVLNSLAASVTATTMINLGDTMSIATGGQQAAASASVNVLQMLLAAAYVVDGTHAVSIPQTQLNLGPKIGAVDVSLNVISPPKTAFGPVGTTASTSQVQLTLTPHLTISTSGSINTCSLLGTATGNLLTGLLSLLNCVLPLNQVVSLDLNAAVPINLTVAGAQGTLSAINCASPQSITVTPQVQALNLTSNVDLTFTGTILGINLGNVVRIRGSAAAISQTTPSAQVFLNPSQFGVARSVGTTPLALAGLTAMTTSNVTVLDTDFGTLLSPLTNTLLSTVNTALGAVDTTLASVLNHLLQLGIGGADITALSGSLSCNALRLAG